MNSKHEANRRRWNAVASNWKEKRDQDGYWKRCHTNPSFGLEGETLDILDRYVGDLSGKTACVLGSGDNYAVFALAGLGVRVTSVDISEEQLKVAADRAGQLGLDIKFVRSDITNLADIQNDTFDMVCSTNGVMVWITDLKAYYGEAHRILKPGGIYFSYEIHPFQRPWKDFTNPLEMDKPYFDNDSKEYVYDTEGKHYALASDVAPELRARGATAFCMHWTLGDFLMGLIKAGLELIHIIEGKGDTQFWYGLPLPDDPDPKLNDWRQNPQAGLPAWLTLVAKKN